MKYIITVLFILLNFYKLKEEEYVSTDVEKIIIGV